MHRCRVHQLDADLLDRAEEQNNRDLERLAEHYAGKPWTLDHDSRIRLITTPKWMIEKPEADDGPSPLGD